MGEKIKVNRTTPETADKTPFQKTRKHKSTQPSYSPLDNIMNLQRTAGNRSVQELFRTGAIRAKLTVNQPDDIYEKEADRLAEQFMQMPGLKQAEEEKEEVPVQAKLSNEQPYGENVLTKARLHAGGCPGRPLPRTTRDYFEPRFGRDFSNVRVHTCCDAVQMNREINAQAFTHGNNIYFNRDKYNPENPSGKRLLAHELTHVTQQHHKDMVRLKPKPKPKSRTPKDVVLLMADDADLKTEGKMLAPGGKIIRISSADEMVSALNGVSFPIRNLVIISHALPSGDLSFDSGDSRSFVRPSILAEKLKTVTLEKGPRLIDFRGCTIGTSPEGMEQIRAALDADAAIGSNCYLISLVQGPVTLDDERITKPSQVSEEDRSAFETGLKMLIETFGDSKKCIFDKSESAYFLTGGKFVAQWASPTMSTAWDERKSKCYNNMAVEKVVPKKGIDTSPGIAGHCKLIKVEKTK